MVFTLASTSATVRNSSSGIALAVCKSYCSDPARTLDNLQLERVSICLQRTSLVSENGRTGMQVVHHGLGAGSQLPKRYLQSNGSLLCPFWKKRGSAWKPVCKIFENKDRPIFLHDLEEFTRKSVKPIVVSDELLDSCHSCSTSSNGFGVEGNDILKDMQRLLKPEMHLHETKLVADVWECRPPSAINKNKSFLTHFTIGPRNLKTAPRDPLPPFTGTFITLFGLILIVGIIRNRWVGALRGVFQLSNSASRHQFDIPTQPPAPTGISEFLERDLRRKESVEWVNMVLGKLWKVYRLGLERWLAGLLQLLIDNLQKPDYVKRVEIKQLFLGDEPLSVRSVERRTSRRVNDLQYHIGLRYTGGARVLLLLKLKLGFLPIIIPVGVRGLDVDGELWVKLCLVPSEPYVGTATWAFVSLPKIKLDLALFRFFNLMAVPFLSMFLTELLTQDLPQLFVHPNKNVINFLQGKSVGPVPRDFRRATVEGNRDFSGELSVTLVDARKLSYNPYGKTDPYVVLILGDQVIQSKKNSQTSVIGPPGCPIWNQDFQLHVVDPKTQGLSVQVREAFGFAAFTVGYGEVELSTLQDTVPADRVVTLSVGWGPFRKSFAGEVLLRLTYKSYVEDEVDDEKYDQPLSSEFSNGETSESEDNSEALSLLNRIVTKAMESVQFKESIADMFGAVVAELHCEDYKQGISATSEKAGKNEASREPFALGVVSRGLKNKVVQGNKDPSFPEGETMPEDKIDNGTVLAWLGLITGAALLVALSLNFSSWLNP